ncbi:MAG: hypothetical protein IPI10_01220 [Bacteroidetes bacterium]|nr:hypothetical protein [Bacteroidota bacterium]
MSELYKSTNSPGRSSKFFGITFLLFQLFFSGLLLFYVLRKSETGLEILNVVLK